MATPWLNTAGPEAGLGGVGGQFRTTEACRLTLPKAASLNSSFWRCPSVLGVPRLAVVFCNLCVLMWFFL